MEKACLKGTLQDQSALKNSTHCIIVHGGKIEKFMRLEGQFEFRKPAL